MSNQHTSTIILASSSPRRAFLLKQAQIPFTVKKFDFAEDYPHNLPAEDVPLYIAKSKMKQIENPSDEETYITADTVVIHQGKVMGKPKDIDDAIQVLHKLSGDTHKVTTGVCIGDGKNIHAFQHTTEVSFYHLSEEEISYYCHQHKPLDKAGAYGIQEWIGQIGVSHIKGSYENVIGLPVAEVYQYLKKAAKIS